MDFELLCGCALADGVRTLAPIMRRTPLRGRVMTSRDDHEGEYETAVAAAVVLECPRCKRRVFAAEVESDG